MQAWLHSKLESARRKIGIAGPLDWSDAQRFELHHAIQYMQTPGFAATVDTLNSLEKNASTGYVDPLMLKEFFASDHSIWLQFVDHIRGKTTLEIGPCIATQLSLWDIANRRIVIEPLYNQVVEYQAAHFGKTAFRQVEAFTMGAEKLIDELVGKVDGALLIRNCLDHSPAWPFILSNIADYMAPGSVLLLWNDLLHPKQYLNGHYDITDNVASFRRLIENLGFEILDEYENPTGECLNFGCRALRK